jgi:hypothetical protein
MSDDFFEAIKAVAVHQLPDVCPCALVLHPNREKLIFEFDKRFLSAITSF